MVSGLVTSPFDQSRICSGDASEMRMALKLLTSSISSSVLEPGQVDPAQIGQRVGRDVLGEVDLFLVLVEDLDVETEALELLDEHLEGLRHTRRLDVLALDDRLVGLDAAHDVVRLDRQQLLQDVGGAVGL